MLDDHFLNHPGLQHFWDRLSSLFARKTELPTKVSELTNDAGYITGETDPTVPAWAKATTKPTYTALEVKALPDPVKLTYADLTKADNDIPAGTAADFKAIFVQDKNGKPVGYIIVQALNDGKTTIGVYAGNYVNGGSLAGGMRIIMDKAGSWSYQIANPAGFRSAIVAQQDVGLYIDAQGYICQRIGSDT